MERASYALVGGVVDPQAARPSPTSPPRRSGSGSVSYEPLAKVHGLTSLFARANVTFCTGYCHFRRWREHPAAHDAELALFLELPQDIPAIDR